MKRILAGILAALLTIGMAGCAGDKTASSAAEPSSTEELSSVPPILGVELEKMLTAGEFSALQEAVEAVNQ